MSETEFPDEMPPIQQIGTVCGDMFLARMQMAAEISRYTDSPIETMLGLALAEKLHASGRNWSMEPRPDGWIHDQGHIVLIPQLRWRQYRIDWALCQAGKPDLFVECDGNEFHTMPADVQRDMVRDAAAARAGIKTLRFTGAQIFADAAECAYQVLDEVFA